MHVGRRGREIVSGQTPPIGPHPAARETPRPGRHSDVRANHQPPGCKRLESECDNPERLARVVALCANGRRNDPLCPARSGLLRARPLSAYEAGAERGRVVSCVFGNLGLGGAASSVPARELTVAALWIWWNDPIRLCRDDERASVLAIVNAAVQAYRGVIPVDRWREPYMPPRELESEIDAGVAFWTIPNRQMETSVVLANPPLDQA